MNMHRNANTEQTKTPLPPKKTISKNLPQKQTLMQPNNYYSRTSSGAINNLSKSHAMSASAGANTTNNYLRKQPSCFTH